MNEWLYQLISGGLSGVAAKELVLLVLLLTGRPVTGSISEEALLPPFPQATMSDKLSATVPKDKRFLKETFFIAIQCARSARLMPSLECFKSEREV